MAPSLSPSVTQQHLTSREKTESVVKSNGLPPSPPPSTQFPICRVPLSSSTPNKTSVLPPKAFEVWQFIVMGHLPPTDCRFRSGKGKHMVLLSKDVIQLPYFSKVVWLNPSSSSSSVNLLFNDPEHPLRTSLFSQTSLSCHRSIEGRRSNKCLVVEQKEEFNLAAIAPS